MHQSATLFIGRSVLYYDVLPSTNKFAAELVSKTNPVEGCCIITDFQTEGVGQIGRTWFSGRSDNLTVSYILYPAFIPVSGQFLLSMMAAMAVYNTVAHFTNAELKVKWPNDIYIGDRKIAGILIQNQLSGNLIRNTVVGIGVNINQDIFPEWIPNPVSLRSVCGRPVDKNDFLLRLHAELERMYLALKAGKYAAVKELYLSNLYRRGGYHPFREQNGHIFMGEIMDVADDGKLIITTEEGTSREYSVGGIQFIID
jgi:BirA family biotin operon repressor/biotin-[acetyl-CoA-carboxylase] ligase